MAGYVYALSFDRPLAHAQFYLGSTHNFPNRLKQHCKGKGAAITRAAREQGIHLRIEVVLYLPTYKEARQLERKLKRWHCNRKAIDYLKKISYNLSPP